ncbi:hypothetical protein [uncultured Alistipes sp.]|jgi:hypothetical protein|uniref:hypothetical protein n=1 Tax=uncultured Alistipes sp. TaxID=538949 RepID=UPI00261A1DCD|nr:hypothetical protein [uncultured Alistipes sp.]
MPAWIIIVLVSILCVGFFVIGLSLTLIFKGHHIDSEISTNKDMQRLGIRCAVQESRDDLADGDCRADGCSGNCAGCDIDHDRSRKE